MKANRFLLTISILFGLLSCNAQNSTVQAKLTQAEKVLKQHPKDQQAWQQLYALINDNYTKLTAAERAGLRKVLEQYGI